MPALPTVFDTEAIRRGLSTDLAFANRSLHTAGNILIRRDTDNHIAEVVAVVVAIAISMSLLLYWGIKKGGSCNWHPKK